MNIEKIVHDLTGFTVPFLALLAFSSPFISMLFKRKSIYRIMNLIGSLFAALSTSIIFYYVLSTGDIILYKFGGWPPPLGIVYEVDQFSAFLASMTAWIMLAISLYSIWYERELDDYTLYYVLLTGLEAGMLGCLYTGDVFNLFVMIEVLAISAYALVSYHRERGVALEAAMKYALIGALATTFYFLGIIVIYSVYGTLNMAQISLINMVISNYVSRGLAPLLPSEVLEAISVSSFIAVALATWAFTYKAALFPNHFWLPDAHPEAPTPISAALSGLVVNIGVYAVVRFIYTLFAYQFFNYYRGIIAMVLLIAGILGAIIGGAMMILQDDIKRLLAYSTVSHIGIMFMAIGAPLGLLSDEVIKIALTGTGLHIMSHGLAKATLFMTSGVFIESGKTRSLNELRGIGRAHPIASLALLISFLSLTGIVPSIGFYSKLMIYNALIMGGLYIPAVLLIVASAISFLGYFKAIYSIVFAIPVKEYQSKRYWVEYLVLIMSLLLIVLGVIYPFLTSQFETIASSFTLPGRGKYIIKGYREGIVFFEEMIQRLLMGRG